jgi:hypothetical protein
MEISGLNIEDPGFKVVVAISLSEVSLGKADQLLQLANSTSTFQDALLDSVVILTAVAVEQAVYSVGAICAATYAAVHEVPLERAPAAVLLRQDVSIQEKLAALPHVLPIPDGVPELSKTQLSELRDLFAYRNALLHIKEPARVYTAGSHGVQVNDGKLKIAFEWPIYASHRLSRERAKSYLVTARALYDDVLFPASRSMKIGKGWIMVHAIGVSST